jgi:glycosyltransferase involved in cell wall biosynthesis
MNIAIIVQRYGLQINGGAELHARQLAERLFPKHDVSILTTKAESYITWDNNIDTDYEEINGIKVYRFNSGKKDKRATHKVYRKLRNFSKIPIYLRKFGFSKLADSNWFLYDSAFRKWLRLQGPYCPDMIEHIKKHRDDFDVFIFFTYLYYPTNAGLPQVADKSLLIPTAHDEKPFYFPNYKKIFELAKFIMYNSPGEKKLVEETYPKSKNTASDIAGVGIDFPEYQVADKPIKNDYFIYVGRIDTAKNVHQLVEWFEKFAADKDVKLVLVGKNDGKKITGNDSIIFTGFVSEQEKNNWLYHSKALIIPSKFESLSMVTLEAMQMQKPVIANRECDVLADHIQNSKGGFAYSGFTDFSNILNKILNMSDKELSNIGKNGQQYVRNNYQWDKILEKFERSFQYIINK